MTTEYTVFIYKYEYNRYIQYLVEQTEFIYAVYNIKYLSSL